MRNFYRGYNLGLKSWEHLKKPKVFGERGFRLVHVGNESLFLKFGWRFINNTSALWVKILKAKYFSKDNICRVLHRKPLLSPLERYP